MRYLMIEEFFTSHIKDFDVAGKLQSNKVIITRYSQGEWRTFDRMLKNRLIITNLKY